MVIKACSAILFIIGIVVIIISIFKSKGKPIETLRDIIKGWFIPIILGVALIFLGCMLLTTDTNKHDSNLTPNDLKILNENGYDDLSECYVRIINTKEDLMTGYISAYFQRIKTDDQYKENNRYIEIINKENNNQPRFIIYKRKSDDKEKILSREKVEKNFLDKYIFLSKGGERATYYLYDNMGDRYNENELDFLQAICGGIYTKCFEFKKHNTFVLDLYCEEKMPTGSIGDGFTRKYLGRINSTHIGNKPAYHYQQVKNCDQKEIPDIIPIIDEKDFPEKFTHIDGEKQRIVVVHSLPEPSQLSYVFKSMFYFNNNSLEILKPMYVFYEVTIEES